MTGAEVKDLDAFNSSMPHEEVVMDHGRQRRRAVFDVSDEELLKKETMEESEDEVSNWKMGEEGDVESDGEESNGEESEKDSEEKVESDGKESNGEESEESDGEESEDEEESEEEKVGSDGEEKEEKENSEEEMEEEEKDDEGDAMEVENATDEENETAEVPTDMQHESDLRWKENLFYRGEAELTRRRVFSSNLMQLVYGSTEPVDEETDVAKEPDEESDDDFFHPKQENAAAKESEKQQRLLEELDSEKLDILPAVKHVGAARAREA